MQQNNGNKSIYFQKDLHEVIEMIPMLLKSLFLDSDYRTFLLSSIKLFWPWILSSTANAGRSLAPLNSALTRRRRVNASHHRQ